jgi:preprotein translocase subunit SecY
VTGLCLAAWRALEQIPVAGPAPSTMFYRLQSLDTSTFLHAIGSGIPLASYSIVVMGLQPYINALIVMTILEAISKRVQAMSRTPTGKHAIRQWGRVFTLLLAAGQAYGFTVLWQVDSSLPAMDWFARVLIVIQLTTGTMVLVLLGDVLDEFGLGFGSGAILIYALGPLATQVHRLAAIIAPYSSIEALYRPLGLWLVFSIGVAAATVAALLAVRRIPPVETKKSNKAAPAELRILLSGVLRPPIFANGVLFLPAIAANYLAAAHPQGVLWVEEHLTSYGPNPWTDAGYAALNASLVVAFAYFVVVLDFGAGPRELAAHIHRLAFAGGIFLATMVVVVPIVEWHATGATGKVIGMSGFDIVLVVAMIAVIVDRLEHSAAATRRVPILMSRVP